LQRSKGANLGKKNLEERTYKPHGAHKKNKGIGKKKIYNGRGKGLEHQKKTSEFGASKRLGLGGGEEVRKKKNRRGTGRGTQDR